MKKALVLTSMVIFMFVGAVQALANPNASQISLISPADNKILSFGSTGGSVQFMFTKVTGAAKYILHIELYDILTNYSVPVPLDLVPPGPGDGTWGGGSSATPGFSETALGMVFDFSLDDMTWDVLALYDLLWGVEAYDASGNLIGSTLENGVAQKFVNKVKFIASNSIVLTNPLPGSSLYKADPVPIFQWETYPGSGTYTVILAKVGALGFDQVIQEDNLTLNILTMDSSTWQGMPEGTWYWTVLGYDGSGALMPTDFTIFDFTVQTGSSPQVPQDLALSKTSLILQAGESEVVSITGGTGTYTASSSDSQVATVSVTAGGVETKGVSHGTATVTVEDTAGNTVNLYVAVNDTKQVTITQKTITIDGNFDDWAGIQPVFIEGEDDKDPGANFPGTDIKSFYLAKDDQFLYMMMELYDGNPRTESTTVYQFQANQSQFKADTPGDIFIGAYTSPDPGTYTVGVNERPSTKIKNYPSSHMAIGNNRIEWKAELSVVGDLNNKYVRVYTHVLDEDNSGNLIYPISDSNNFPFEISILDTDGNNNTCFSIPKKSITIDGQFDDWIGVPVFIQDKLDETTGSFEDDIDKVFIAMDSEHIYFRIDLRADGGDFNLFNGNVRFESYDPSIGLERWFTYWFGNIDPKSGVVEIMDKWDNGVVEIIKNYSAAYGYFKDNQLEYKIKLSDTTDFDISGKFMKVTLFNSVNPLHGDGTKNVLICTMNTNSYNDSGPDSNVALYDGKWTGTTSQQEFVEFEVVGNKITTFKYTISIPGIVKMDTEISGSPTVAFIDTQDKFSIDSNYSYGSSGNLKNGKVVFTGIFENDLTCKGNFQINDPTGIYTGTWEAFK
jgi:hypothetical protein